VRDAAAPGAGVALVLRLACLPLLPLLLPLRYLCCARGGAVAPAPGAAGKGAPAGAGSAAGAPPAVVAAAAAAAAVRGAPKAPAPVVQV
jgi:hypothetical protein